MDAEQDLALAIAELLHAHADCLDQFGTTRPETNAMLGSELITKMRRQRAKVDASLDGPPATHAAHVRALTQGMRTCMRRLQELDP
jgi:hypothetical protein